MAKEDKPAPHLPDPHPAPPPGPGPHAPPNPPTPPAEPKAPAKKKEKATHAVTFPGQPTAYVTAASDEEAALAAAAELGVVSSERPPEVVKLWGWAVPSYANNSGKSNVRSYETGVDFISVTFKDGSTYTYTHASAGRSAVNYMKRLAAAGWGLNAYVNLHVKYAYT